LKEFVTDLVKNAERLHTTELLVNAASLATSPAAHHRLKMQHAKRNMLG
jgi:hypothetical protein